VTTPTTKHEWDVVKAKAKAEHQREMVRFNALDQRACALREQIADTYAKAGRGEPPAVQPGMSVSDYQRLAVNDLKAVAGLSSLVTDGLKDGSMPYLLGDVIGKVNENYRRPPDLAPGESRVLDLKDQTGRVIQEFVYGKDTPSPFRSTYGAFLAEPREAVAFRGRPFSL
jgi:hypothetical protein